MGFIAEFSSAMVDLVSRLMGAPTQGSRDPAIFLALLLAGVAILWLRRTNSILSDELLRTREVLLEKGRIDDLKIKMDDIGYKVNTELTNFSRQLQKDGKRLGTLEERLTKQPVGLELDNSENSLENRLQSIERSLGLAPSGKIVPSAIQVEELKAEAVVDAPIEKKGEAIPTSAQVVSPWRLALDKTRQRLHKQLLSVVGRTATLGAGFPKAVLEVLEEHGLAGCWTAEFQAALDGLIQSSRATPSALGERIESMLAEAIKKKLQAGGEAGLLPTLASQRPRVVMLLGSSGAERLEVAAELAVFLKALGAKTVLGDCNISSSKNRDKLLVWGEQAGIPVFIPGSKTKAAQVAYRAIHKAQDEHYDLVILHGPDSIESKEGGAEWEQLVSIIDRERPGAPHETLYVDNLSDTSKLDSRAALITPTGLIFTGFDLSDHGGLIMSRAEQLKAPVRFVVLSQPKRQLQPFSPADFATALCGSESEEAPRGPIERAPDHSL